MPQMTLTTTGLPRHFGMATVTPLPSVTVGHSFDSRRRRSCSAMPRRRNHSNGINDSAPNVNRVAPKNRGLMEAMPCTWDTNAKPQIMAVRTRQAMPPISFLCMTHYSMARFSPTEEPDHILVRLCLRVQRRGRRGIFQSRSPKSWRIYRNMLMKSRYRFSAQMMETFLIMSSPWPAYWANSARVAWAS